MCKDAKSSLTGWILGTLTGLLLWYRNHLYDRPLAGLIIVFSQIQLIEYAAWSHWDTKLAGKMIPLALISQVIVFTGLVYLLVDGGYSLNEGLFSVGCHNNTHLIEKPQKSCSLWLLAILILVIIAGVTILYDNITCSSQYDMKVGTNGHWVWLKNGKSNPLGYWAWIYLLGLFLPLIWLYVWSGYQTTLLILLLFAIITAIWSLVQYYHSGEFGSMWRFIAVGFAFLVFLLN